MNWSDTMKEYANRVSGERTFTTDPRDMQVAGSIAWDPHDVWLTRVKQPRDRAAVPATAATMNQAGMRQD